MLAFLLSSLYFGNCRLMVGMAYTRIGLSGPTLLYTVPPLPTEGGMVSTRGGP